MVAEVLWTGLFSQELSCCRVRGLAAGSEQVVHTRFALTLVVNHACNLRCTYCFTGDKVRRPMRLATGRKAIDRALQSLLPGGTLHLGFFGGEPLIEAELILALVAHARAAAAHRGVDLVLGMTTNGTIDTDAARMVMWLAEMQLAISHDGLPEVHDRHRLTIEGQPSSRKVQETIVRLVQDGRRVRVVTVVRPDSVGEVPAGLEYLYDRGVRQFDPSLDLWAVWTRADGERLADAIRRAADFWVARLPDCGVSWFDEKAARLAQVPVHESARCGFGCGEIAVTPAGSLFPCERLVGADEPLNPHRLPGGVFDGDDFLGIGPAASMSASECTPCSLRSLCATNCRCSNFIRTGDVTRPDALLCLWDQSCHRETARVLRSAMTLSP